MERLRVDLAREANKKVYVIMALLAAAKVKALAVRLPGLDGSLAQHDSSAAANDGSFAFDDTSWRTAQVPRRPGPRRRRLTLRPVTA
jgi:hypothetical protein